MSHNPTFSTIIKALLKGKMMCAVTSEAAFQYLSSETGFQTVDDYLRQIDRTLCLTLDRKGYYCAFSEPEEPSTHKAIREQFKIIAQQLEPIVQFLRLCRVAQPGAEPISAGEPLYESQLLSQIESSGAAQQLLDDLAKSHFVNSKASDGKGQLHMLMLRLVEQGYLISVGKTGAHYIATAKWSWLYESMAFIQAHEHLSELESTETDPEQLGIIEHTEGQ
jgi:hypothetical protein